MTRPNVNVVGTRATTLHDSAIVNSYYGWFSEERGNEITARRGMSLYALIRRLKWAAAFFGCLTTINRPADCIQREGHQVHLNYHGTYVCILTWWIVAHVSPAGTLSTASLPAWQQHRYDDNVDPRIIDTHPGPPANCCFTRQPGTRQLDIVRSLDSRSFY